MDKQIASNLYPPELFQMIRGFPRKRENINTVEQQLGGRLLSDLEADLMWKLDSYLARANKELGHYPEYIVLPSEPNFLFVPVPFEIYVYGLTLNSYHKPAWFKIKRNKVVPALPWKN